MKHKFHFRSLKNSFSDVIRLFQIKKISLLFRDGLPARSVLQKTE